MARGRSLVIIAALVLGLESSRAAHGERPQKGDPHLAALFDPASLELPSKSPERLARKQLDEGHPAEAQRILLAGLQRSRDAGQRGRLRWLLANAHGAQESRDAMRKVLAELGASSHPLAARARLRLAQDLHEEDPNRALTLLQGLDGGYPFSRRASVLQGLAHKHAGRFSEARQVLEPLVSAAPHSLQGVMALADLLALETGADNRLRAIELYQRVISGGPLSAQGKLAAERRAALLEQLSTADQRKALRISTEDRFAEGEALVRTHAYGLAVKHFKALVADLGYDAQLKCDAQLQLGRALLRKRDRRAAAEELERVLSACREPELRAWARYYAGQAYTRLGEPEPALQHYDALHGEALTHRLADDALYQGALAALSLEDNSGMRVRLRRLVEQHPEGDMLPEARFMLAWEARERHAYHEALVHLEPLVAHPEYEAQEGTRGRAAYWRARTLQDLGRTALAVRAYTEVARAQRLGYHAQQALARLRRLAPATYKKLLAEAQPQAPKRLRFPRLPTMDSPGFATAAALLQVGEIRAADEELRHLGLSGKAASAEHTWLVAAMFHASGAFPKASGLARQRLDEFASSPPRGEALSKWNLAYPKAFAPAIERAAAEAHVPAAYVRAVAREESAFDPRAVSTAHAYGLIQLIRPTAKQFAKPLGLPTHPEALKTPRINLRIGSHFIQHLYERFKTNPAVVPAAYNAGPGAVERWIRERPDQPLDEWVESIPYSETRRYTRRVLQTYGTYAFLETGRFPELPETLPH